MDEPVQRNYSKIAINEEHPYIRDCIKKFNARTPEQCAIDEMRDAEAFHKYIRKALQDGANLLERDIGQRYRDMAA